MSSSFSRRNFLKASSTAGLTAAVLGPASSFAKPIQKSRVVIAKDETCLNGSNGIESKIQDMVDNAIMTFTDIKDKGKAYEAMFPNGITASTKILIKRNDIGGSNAISRGMVINCLKKGMGNMLGGSFNTSNVEIFNRNACLLSNINNSDYLINSPVPWCHSLFGVTLSLKNTMGYLKNPMSMGHSNRDWLHENSLDPRIKDKQVFGLMDCLVGNNSTGPASRPNFEAHTIILSRDLVAIDHNAIKLMESKPNANSGYMNRGKGQLDKAQSTGLGTCTEANMEIINIKPPWIPTGIKNKTENYRNSIRVLCNNYQVEFILPSAHNAKITVFNLQGKLVWQAKNISTERLVWKQNSLTGMKVPPGKYTYLIVNNNIFTKGSISISR